MADKKIEALEKQNKLTEKLLKTFKDYKDISDKTFKGNVQDLMNLNKVLKEGVSEVKDMSKEVRALHIKGALGLEEANDLNNTLLSIEGKLGKIYSSKTKSVAQWDKQKKKVADLNKELANTKQKIVLAQNTAKSFVDHMEDAGPSFMKGWAQFNKASKKGQTTVQSYEGLFNKASIKLSGMPGLMKKFGAAAKGASSMLGGITKIIAGWPGAIFMAVKALWDVGMQADQFVKDSNKAFAVLRGPDIMTGDIQKQFKDFNDQIFKASENIRVGMDVTQVRELMEAMVQAGSNIQNLNKGLLSYRDAIYIAGKASKTLGLVLPQVGNMIGKMLTDFRMDMEGIDKAFVQVAFDAQKSGLSTDRFWSTVENASASLAMYGVFVSSASKTMKRFTEDMVGGADDAAEATEDMYGVFKSGNMKAQAALLSLAKESGVSINKVFKDMGAEFADQAVKLQSEIQLLEAKDTKTPEDVEHLKRLRSELASAQSKSQRALDMIGKDSVVQTSEMGMLAKEAPQLLINTIKKVASVGDLTQISGESLLVAIKGMEAAGVKEKTVRMLVEQAKVTKKGIENLLGSSQKYFSTNKKDFQDNKKGIADAIMAAAIPGKDQAENSAKLVDLLMKSLGMDEGMASTWAEIIKTDKKTAENIATRIEKGDAENLKGIDGLLKSSSFLTKYQVARFKSQEKTEGELAKASEDSFKELVKGTLSYKEMVEIGKDELTWRASNIGVLTAMNKGVADIYGWLTKNDNAYMSETQKLAQEQLKASLIGNQELGKLLAVDKDGNLTNQSQLALIKKTTEDIQGLNELVAIEQGVQDALNESMRADDPMQSLAKAGKSALEAGNSGVAGAIMEQMNKLRALSKERPGENQKFLVQELASKNEESLRVLNEQKATQEAMKRNLMEMNRTNENIYKIQKLKLMGDDKSLKGIAEEIHKTAGDDKRKIQEMTDRLGLDLTDVKKAYEAKGISTDVIDKMIKGKEVLKSVMSAATTPVSHKAFQGLQKPMQVTSPGSVTLHTGETVLPKTFSELKTSPTFNEPVGGRMGGAAGGSKQININVTATEKDLANKIANSVRAVMNQEYIGA